ncbi:murein biosynthesis integral membrane protein MurJ [Calderihabitans maritimus]|uniref:Probable lipid II flippase MurJ n=1 Tax=Calderihabitans maritimus TaxID=1246530 RepID=A0A1Z5HVT9_9FIRM|nr:murein biosynthesis integral membrane protein MurJ [Calderihabitans maritimus]GAW93457.1 virulence factor MviN [Calderihabitans maritimus]
MEGQRVAKAAGLIMISMVVSRILGYLRDVVIYAQFGQNRITDAYNAAFSVPDFLYMLLVGGALSSSFIPVFSSYIATEREKEAWEMASIVFNVIMVLMVVGISLGLIYTPKLIYLLVPGFNPASLELTVMLTRIMFAQAFFMALSGMSMGILNSYKHFFAPALGSVLYNLAIIAVGLLLSPLLGIAGFSVGVVVGAMLNFGVQLPVLIRMGLRYRFSFNLTHPGVRKLGSLMLPVLIGLSVTQFNLFVNQNLASTLAPGIVAALRTAQRLMQLPIGVFAIAVAVAVFPTLTSQAARKEREQFKHTMSLGIRSVIFLTVPAAAGLISLRVPIVRLLFEQGKFTPQATQATAYALLFYSLGLFAYSAIQVLNRVFYALHDTRTPVTGGVLTILLNIYLNFVLIKKLGHGGLALAYSVAGIFNMMLLLFILKRKLGGINGYQMLFSFVKSLFAASVMGLCSYVVASYIEQVTDISLKINQALQVFAAAGAGMIVYILLALIFRMEEATMVMGILKRRFSRPV